MRRLLILFALATAFIGIGELQAQECERLYPRELNKTCRAVQTPTVERVSLEAVAVTKENEPQSDYCRLDTVVYGNMQSLQEALESNKVRVSQVWLKGVDEFDRHSLASGSFIEQGMRLTFTSNTDFFGCYPNQFSRYVNENTLSYVFLKNRGLPEGLGLLQEVEALYMYVSEADTGYSFTIPIQPPRESTNLPALYQKCLSDIELAREAVKRRIYVTKQEVAVDLARASAEAEVTFLQKEIAFMQDAVAEMEVAIGKAEEAIDQMLAHRRTLLLVEETFGNILNAFWSGTFSKYQSFSAWANERLESIDNQLNEAEQYKKDIEAIEIEFLIQLNETKLRAAEKAREIEELGEGQ